MGHRMRRILTTFFLTLPLISFAKNTPVQHYTLSNGLNIYVKTIKRSPVVLSQVWYRVGGSYEHNGITGLSHLLEHMMFKGTTEFPGDAFTKTITKLGGVLNAMTADDFTMYYELVPKSALPTVFKLEADRMHNLVISQDSFDKELDVVKNEKKLRVDNVPFSRAYQQFRAQTYISNPYHHTPIGWQNDLDNMTMQDARNWYQHYYQPNNADLVVVGDVSGDTVYQLAQQYFGPLKAHKVIQPKPRAGETHFSYRVSQLFLPAQQPAIIMGYNVPNYQNITEKWKAYALVVLANALGGTSSSILNSTLVRNEKLAADIDAQFSPFTLHNTAFVITAAPTEKTNPQILTEKIISAVNRIKSQPLDAEQLQFVKTQIKSQKIFNLDSLNDQAGNIGGAVSINLPYQLSENFLENIQKVTPKQVELVAKEFLTMNRLSIVYLLPETRRNQHA